MTDRAHPGYQALGLPLGGFRVYPSLATTVAYDDDLYASTSIRAKDAFAVLTPRVVLKSNWQRNRLTVAGYGTFRRYAKYTIENSEQYGATLDGQYDISHAANVVVSGTLARKIESRGTEGDTFIGSEPVSYREASGSVELTQQVGRFTLSGGGDYANYKYNDLVVAGVLTNLSFRNYESISGDARIMYRISPGIAIFTTGAINQGTYANEPAVQDRNSHGYSALGGVTFGISPLLTGEVGLGYIKQSFDNPIFPSVSGINYRASILWNPTPLTTATLKVDKSIQRGPLVGVAGIQYTEASLKVDYELLRNLILTANAVYSVGSYQGIDRSDNRLSWNFMTRYFMTRHVSFSASAAHVRQRPGGNTVVGRAYDRNQVLFGITLQQ